MTECLPLKQLAVAVQWDNQLTTKAVKNAVFHKFGLWKLFVKPAADATFFFESVKAYPREFVGILLMPLHFNSLSGQIHVNGYGKKVCLCLELRHTGNKQKVKVERATCSGGLLAVIFSSLKGLVP
jgi:hypothetical protein